MRFQPIADRNQLTAEETAENEHDSRLDKKVSRREFLKYGMGVAAVAAGATGLLGKIPLPSESAPRRTVSINDGSEPIVVSVKGDQITVMSGHSAVKVRDPALSAQIANKLQ